MPRDVNGNTQPLPGTIVATGDTILPSQHNPMVNDVYAMMAQSLSRDGQGGMRSPLNMSGFPVTNIGTGTLSNDAVTIGQFQTGTPVGAIMDYAGSSPPATWDLCYGQAISRTTYAILFAAIGTTFGAGDGSTTFNLPDLRGRVTAGKDNMGGTDATRLSSYFGAIARTLGGVMGAASHILTVGEMPPHRHGGTTSVDGSHDHQTAGYMATGGGDTISVWGNGARSDTSNRTLASGSHSHIISLEGGGNNHTNTQPTIIMNKIIKVSY